MAEIVVIGLGVMGLPIARNLRDKGHVVSGIDLDRDRETEFEKPDQRAEDKVGGAEIVITMLPEGRHVATIHSDLILSNAAENAVLIDCSTIDVDTTRALGEAATAAGFAFVDAPVSGGPEAAGTGALSFMVGGAEPDFHRAEPILNEMGKKVTYFGASGSGQAAKACHNMICGITAMAVTEGFALADALNLDLNKFYTLCSGAAAQSWTLENRCPIPGVAPTAPSSNEFAPGFAAGLMAKDLRLAQAAAKSSGQETPFGAEAARKFTEFAEAGGGAFDFSAIYKTLRPLPAAN